MENASKALIIAGAILLSILIIAVGMFIFTSSQTTIQEGTVQISTQERNAFNQQFTQYEKKQGGSNVAQLIQNLIANCNSNAEEEDKLPDLVIESSAKLGGYVVSKNKSNTTFGTNVVGFTNAKNLVESRHTYYVTIEYNPVTSLVDFILVEYGKGNFDSVSSYRQTTGMQEVNASAFGGANLKQSKSAGSMSSSKGSTT